MSTQIVSLMFLLSLASLCQSMEQSGDTESHKGTFVENYLEEEESRSNFTKFIKKSSLKTQVAIKIIQFLSEDTLKKEQLELLSLDLLQYLVIHENIAQLHPENSLKSSSSFKPKVTFYFLKSLYLLEQNPFLFSRVDLLFDGLEELYKIKENKKVMPLTLPLKDSSKLDPIQTLSKIIHRTAELASEDREIIYNNTDFIDESLEADVSLLAYYCTQYNNLNLAIFLNFIKKIPLSHNLHNATPEHNSLINTAVMVPENNKDYINFLIKEALNRENDEEQIIAVYALLYGILSPYKEKREYLINLANNLEINSNQYIGLPIEITTPIVYAVARGYPESFTFFLPRIKSSLTDLQNIYNNILEQFSSSIIPLTKQDKYLNNLLIILNIFQKHITEHNLPFAIQNEERINKIEIYLTSKLKELSS